MERNKYFKLNREQQSRTISGIKHWTLGGAPQARGGSPTLTG